MREAVELQVQIRSLTSPYVLHPRSHPKRLREWHDLLQTPYLGVQRLRLFFNETTTHIAIIVYIFVFSCKLLYFFLKILVPFRPGPEA